MGNFASWNSRGCYFDTAPSQTRVDSCVLKPLPMSLPLPQQYNVIHNTTNTVQKCLDEHGLLWTNLKLLVVRTWDATEPWTERRPFPLPHWTMGIHWHALHRYACHRAYKQVILRWCDGKLVCTFLCLLNNCMIKGSIHQGGQLGNSFALSTQVENEKLLR